MLIIVDLSAELAHQLLPRLRAKVTCFQALYVEKSRRWGCGPDRVILRTFSDGYKRLTFDRAGHAWSTTRLGEPEEYRNAYLDYTELYDFFWGLAAMQSFYKRMTLCADGGFTLTTVDGDVETYDSSMEIFRRVPVYYKARGVWTRENDAQKIILFYKV